MRMARCRVVEGAGYYHCISRVVDRRLVFGEQEKERFVALMRGYEAFCGMAVVTFCVMGNHFHILVKVPPRPEPAGLPTDAELVERLRQADYSYGAVTLEQDLARLRAEGADGAAEELRERFFCRMWDVSWFMKMLKQRFSQWFNGRYERRGTLWEERFRSVLVEGEAGSRALAVVAAYIDLNPFRAGLVEDPANYRWSGYGEAAGGGGKARAGLALAVEAVRSVVVEEARVLEEYRKHLYLEGENEWRNEDGQVVRRGFARERVAEVLARGGRLSLCQALRCKVRYFCDGMALGSRAFVERHFAAHRHHFGPRREEGARAWRGIDAPELFVLRGLRRDVIEPRRGG